MRMWAEAKAEHHASENLRLTARPRPENAASICFSLLFGSFQYALISSEVLVESLVAVQNVLYAALLTCSTGALS